MKLDWETEVVCRVGDTGGRALAVLMLVWLGSGPSRMKKIVLDGKLGAVGAEALSIILRDMGVPWDSENVHWVHVRALIERLATPPFGPLKPHECLLLVQSAAWTGLGLSAPPTPFNTFNILRIIAQVGYNALRRDKDDD